MTKFVSGLVAAAFSLALIAPASAAVAPRVAADSQIIQVQAEKAEKKAPAKKKASKKPTKKTAKKAKKAPAKTA